MSWTERNDVGNGTAPAKLRTDLVELRVGSSLVLTDRVAVQLRTENSAQKDVTLSSNDIATDQDGDGKDRIKPIHHSTFVARGSMMQLICSGAAGSAWHTEADEK